MLSSRVGERANVACKLLEISMMVVAVVGTVLAVGAVVLGFFVDEPWTYGLVTATEDWHSVLTGIIIGASIAIQTLVVYAILAYLDAKAEALGEESVGQLPNPTPSPTD